MNEPRLIVVRHGSYLRQEFTLPEDERPLSAAGKEEMKAIASIIRRCLRAGEPLFIYSSPTVRAVQSAEIICDTVGRGRTVTTLPLLCIGSQYALGDYAAQVKKFATNLPLNSTTVAVTHITQVMDIVAACGHKKPKESEVLTGSGFLLTKNACTPLH